MLIPREIGGCLDALEQAGYEAYLVGGCVRDALLGLTPHDFDICTSALPEQTQAVFSGCRLVENGKKHGTIGVVTGAGVVEITTYRTEGGYGDCRHPDWVEFVGDLREDLERRDFTINAMAWSPARGLQDPFGGREDLKNGVLRAVGDPSRRFREDSLRILRGVRFAVRFRLTVEEETWQAMVRQAGLMDALARERVYEELCRILPLVTAEDLCRFAPILAAAVPELGPMIGFDQHSPHHAYDLFTHTAHVVAAVPEELTLRWAALLHDTGKVPCFTQDENGRGHFYGHAPRGAQIAGEVLTRLRAPTALRERAVTLIAQHMTRLEPDRKLLRRALGRLGWEGVEQLLSLQEADMISKGTGEHDASDHFTRVREALSQLRQEEACFAVRDLAVNGRDLMALGLHGADIGLCQRLLLSQVLDENLPNEKDALLGYARAWAATRG